jgi:hypothetical protein
VYDRVPVQEAFCSTVLTVVLLAELTTATWPNV